MQLLQSASLRALLGTGFVAFTAIGAAGNAHAQSAAYPSRPVTAIAPIAAGGPVDREARVYTNKMGDLMGQPFIIDFKPGAGTTVGGAYVAKSKPDGYTLLIANASFTVYPAFYTDLSFDTVRDFAPVSLMSQRTTVLVVHPSFPAKTYAEYIGYARANPGKINFSALGAGSAPHLGGAWLHNATNTQVTFIQYKGVSTQMPDMLSGRVDATVATLLSVLPLIKSGKMRALAVANTTRSNLLPELATIEELGVPGYNYAAWLGFVAPAGTPAAIVGKLSEGFAKAAKDPEVALPLEAEGSVMLGSTPAQFRQLIVTETALWKGLVQKLGIQLEE